MAKEYWTCTIGPIDRSKVPQGGDSPLRMAVQEAFEKMLGEYAETCSSGWGMKQKEYDKISKLRCKLFRKVSIKPFNTDKNGR